MKTEEPRKGQGQAQQTPGVRNKMRLHAMSENVRDQADKKILDVMNYIDELVASTRVDDSISPVQLKRKIDALQDANIALASRVDALEAAQRNQDDIQSKAGNKDKGKDRSKEARDDGAEAQPLSHHELRRMLRRMRDEAMKEAKANG